MGGPKKFNILDSIDEMVELARSGKVKTMVELALAFDICTDTMYCEINRNNDNAEIRTKVKKIKELINKRWVDMGLSPKLKVNSAIWIFCMKNLHGWKDRFEINYEKLSDDDLYDLSKQAVEVINEHATRDKAGKGNGSKLSSENVD